MKEKNKYLESEIRKGHDVFIKGPFVQKMSFSHLFDFYSIEVSRTVLFNLFKSNNCQILLIFFTAQFNYLDYNALKFCLSYAANH